MNKVVKTYKDLIDEIIIMLWVITNLVIFFTDSMHTMYNVDAIFFMLIVGLYIARHCIPKFNEWINTNICENKK